MKFLVEVKQTVTKSDSFPPKTSSVFYGPFDSLEEAERKVKSSLGVTEVRHTYVERGTTVVDSCFIWPLRDGVQYKTSLTKTYDFSGGESVS